MDSFVYELAFLHRELIRYCSGRLEEMGISRGLLFPLLYIEKKKGCTPSELAAALGLDAGHTNRSLKKLETGGYLIQKKHPKDKRAHVLELTEKGSQVVRESKEMLQEWGADRLARLDEQERSTFLEALHRLSEKQERDSCEG